MEITLENPSRMVLKNYSTSAQFALGLGILIIGLGTLIIGIVFVFEGLLQGLTGIILGLVATMIGIFILNTMRWIVLELDKETNKCYLSTSWILKKESKVIELKKIKGLELQIQIDSYIRGGGAVYNYMLNFILDNGEILCVELEHIMPDWKGDNAPDNVNQHNETQRIANFLGIPLNEKLLPPKTLYYRPKLLFK